MEHHHFAGSLSENAFIGCNVVIESEKTVHTGKISFVEGEIFEVEFPQYKYFDLGDPVKAIIYSPQGMINFNSMVLAKDTGAIVLILPTSIQEFYLKKRQYPRIDVNHQALIYSITDSSLNNTMNLEEPAEITIKNISLGGVGYSGENLDLKEKSYVFVELNFDSSYLCTLEIEHLKKEEDGMMYYGCSFSALSTEKLNTLRSFILKHQVVNRFENKRKEFDDNLTSLNESP